jgi:hypothetical protein
MNLAEYFAANRPVAKYTIGDRVEGRYQGVPYVGTAGSDVMRNETEGSMVTVHLDLPLKTKTATHMHFIRVGYKDIKGLRV